MKTKKGKLYILIGPPAVGKNTLIDAACHRLEGIIRMPSATTRAPREGEIPGISKVFLTDAQFNRYIEQDQFIEWQLLHGHKYGVLRHIVQGRIDQGLDYLADVDVLGAMKLKAEYKENAVLIFVVPPSLEVLEKRIRDRNSETEEQIAIRLSRSKSELTFIPQCDYILMNDDLETAISDLTAIISNIRSWQEVGRKHNPIIHLNLMPITQEQQDMYLRQDKQIMQINGVQGESPHDTIATYYQSLGVQAEIISDRKSKMQEFNKGLDMPQPFWAAFSSQADGVQIDYYYLVKVSSAPENSRSIPIAEFASIPDKTWIDPATFQREIAKYI